MDRQRRPHAVDVGGPHPGRAHDVGEQEGHRPRGSLRHGVQVRTAVPSTLFEHVEQLVGVQVTGGRAVTRRESRGPRGRRRHGRGPPRAPRHQLRSSRRRRRRSGRTPVARSPQTAAELDVDRVAGDRLELVGERVDDRARHRRTRGRPRCSTKPSSSPSSPQSARVHRRTVATSVPSGPAAKSTRSGSCQQTEGFHSIGDSPASSAARWRAQPAPPAKPGRLRKMHAPSTTRVASPGRRRRRRHRPSLRRGAGSGPGRAWPRGR